DTYYIDAAGDRVTETLTGGVDLVHASATHTLGGYVDNLTLEGIANLNGTGNALNNVMTGNAGNNQLRGVVGNDTLDGGAGRDVLTGGAGADVFKFSAATAYIGAPDTVADFSTRLGDSIDISDLLTGYDPLSATLGEFVDFRTVGRTTQLWVDADGSGTGAEFVQIATLNKVTNLTDEDAAVASHFLKIG
ncbi:MAG TPA: type I secretion C-terminal target domain-containing protein, partial [Patescibacteria group bacterium]|nr:type I secretion C-terminal target domain-containing protein [Patescibacteria group bacterium]